MGQPLASCCNAQPIPSPQIVTNQIPKQLFSPRLSKPTIDPIIQLKSISEPLADTLRSARKYRNTPSTQTADQTDKLWQIEIHGQNNESSWIICRGSSKNKQITGQMALYFPNGQIFEGQIRNKQPVQGIYIFKKGCFYVGEMSDFNAQGNGRYQNNDSGYTYDGHWSKSLPHGKGKESYKNGDSYQGEVMYGEKFGQGIYKFSDKKVYVGSFYYNQSDGKGKMVYSDSSYYDGEWKLGKYHGIGTFVFANGEKYHGQYIDGLRHGTGRYTFKNHSYYDGLWENGLQAGKGSFIDGYDTVSGEWREGEFIS